MVQGPARVKARAAPAALWLLAALARSRCGHMPERHLGSYSHADAPWAQPPKPGRPSLLSGKDMQASPNSRTSTGRRQAMRGTARLSACSGAQAVVAAALRLLGALAAAPERAAALAANGTATRQLAAAGQLLARAVDVEAKYLARLEGAARAG